MAIKINGTDVVDNNRKGIFQSTNVGTFANPARPGSAATGDLIWSTTDNQLQVWNGSSWVAAVGAGQVISASGGDTFTPGNGFKLHIFTSPGTFTLSNPSALVDYAIIAGGGGGGSIGITYIFSGSNGPPTGPAGGGGAGGFLLGTTTFSSGSYSVSIGAGGGGGPATPTPGPAWPQGGSGPGSNGGNSSISGPSGTWTATGGGGGGGVINNPSGSGQYQGGNPGGSGGGGFNSAGSGTPGQGFPGHSEAVSPFGSSGGGGGGAGYPGYRYSYFPNTQTINTNVSVGHGLDWGIPGSYGTGTFTNMSPQKGDQRFFAGGGNNFPGFSPPPTGRNLGGGGLGPFGSPGLSNSGQANTGGGGCGTYGSTFTQYPRFYSPGSATPAGAPGGSGIVIIRYRTIQ